MGGEGCDWAALKSWEVKILKRLALNLRSADVQMIILHIILRLL